MKAVTVEQNIDTIRNENDNKRSLEEDINDELVIKKAKLVNQDIKTKDGRPLAKQYPFELDTFQKESVQYIENNESVLVAAHTSAGKTAVAEYAIALALKCNQRVIYTSPIKALSNQKYRDLSEEFSDVGLLTGDVTINPNASCLVMTTEILRSMLYRGSEVVREVAWAIFDEVHYMKDSTRGVVWEESIILLPHNVRYVFLSATIPNAKEFAGWITSIHHQPCHVVYTEYRPTPLQHYMFPSGGDGIHMIVDEKRNFIPENFQKVMAVLSKSNLEKEINSTGKRSKRSDKEGDLMRLVNMLMNKGYGPCIVFSFSKKDCEKYAKKLSQFELTSKEEADLVEEVYRNAIDSLKEEDKNLPQIQSLLPILRRGIGIHHGGLLPILKEVVEILFGEGLLKVLFATETFAMGINMPAKTVIFTAIRKFDGKQLRYVMSGEYIQMSGRAGRRGLDDRGIVIQMVAEIINSDVAEPIVSGQASPLSSTFYLNYNMLLNLFRIEDSDPEYIIRNSLFAYQQELEVPALEEELKQLEDDLSEIIIDKDKESRFIEYHAKVEKINRLRDELREITMKPENVGGFLREGRCLKLLSKEKHNWYGIVFKVLGNRDQEREKLIVVTLCQSIPKQKNLGTDMGSRINFEEVKPFENLKDAVPKFVLVNLSQIEALSTLRLKSAEGLKKISNVHPAMSRFYEEYPEGLPIMDPVKDLKIDDSRIEEILEEAEDVQNQLLKDPVHSLPKEERESLYEVYLGKYEKRKAIRQLKVRIREVKAVPMKEKLRRMKIVLQRLDHLDSDNVIQLKGRVACEISSAHELVVTELLLSGAMNSWKPSVASAVLSAVIFTERGEENVPLPVILNEPYKKLLEIAKQVANVQKDANMEIEVDEFVDQFKPDIMEAVYKWCQGERFSDVMQVTGVFEGNLIRCIRRLVELLRQLCVAAKVVGDVALENLFKKSIEKMKRDIIFAGSLYLQE